MGANNSASFARYTNDFELIVRASKELEDVLEKEFGAPEEKDQGLHDKISAARHNGQPLPDALIRKMRYLVTIRNKIVHERDFNAIPDRTSFIKSYDDVFAELRAMRGPKPSGDSGCAVQ